MIKNTILFNPKFKITTPTTMSEQKNVAPQCLNLQSNLQSFNSSIYEKNFEIHKQRVQITPDKIILSQRKISKNKELNLLLSNNLQNEVQYQEKYQIIQKHSDYPMFDEKKKPLPHPQQSLEIFKDTLVKDSSIENGVVQKVIYADDPNKTDIFRLRFYYFRLKIKNRLSPLAIQFITHPPVKTQLLRIFVSTKSQHPNSFNADYCIKYKKNQFALIQSENKSRNFLESNLFIQFYSYQDTTLMIKLSFGGYNSSIQCDYKKFESEKQEMRNKIQQANSQSLQLLGDMQSKKLIEVDKIIRNLSMQPFKPMIKSRVRFQKQICLEDKLFEVTEKAKFLKDQKKIHYETKMIAIDNIKTIRSQQKTALIERNKRNSYAFNWLQLFYMLNLCENILNVTQNYRKKRQSIYRGKLMVTKFYAKKVKEIKPFGKTSLERVIFQSKKILEIFCTQLKPKIKKRSQHIVSIFLIGINPLLTFLNKHRLLTVQIISLQRFFRQNKRNKRYYIQRVSKLVFKQFNEQYEVYHRKKFGKKIQKKEVIDRIAMNLIIDKWTQQRNQIWLSYYKVKILHAGIKNIGKYDSPNDDEIEEMCQIYFEQKTQL